MSTPSYHFPEFAIGAGYPFRQAVESSGRPMELAVHSEPITFLSGRLPLLSPTVPRPEGTITRG